MISLTRCITPTETAQFMADNFRELRLEIGLKRSTLARQAGVSEASLKRFENSGQVSLKNLLRLAHSLDRLHGFADLFTPAPASSLAELRGQVASKKLTRGTR